jgi:hypothetical protein
MDVPGGKMLNHIISVDRVPDYAAFVKELKNIYKDSSNFDILDAGTVYAVTGRISICPNPMKKLEELGIVRTIDGELKDRHKDVPTCRYEPKTERAIDYMLSKPKPEPQPSRVVVADNDSDSTISISVTRSESTQSTARNPVVSEWLNNVTIGSDSDSFRSDGRVETIYSDSDLGAMTTAELSQALVRLRAGAGPGPSTASGQTPASSSTALIRRDTPTALSRRSSLEL